MRLVGFVGSGVVSAKDPGYAGAPVALGVAGVDEEGAGRGCG